MKRILSIILSVLLTMSICLTAEAAEVSIFASGDGIVISDENWTYEKIKSYGWKILEYIGSDTDVNLPWTFAKEYIIEVGNYAFDDNTAVTAVKTSGVLETLGNYAFDGCSSLEKITLFDALKTLGVGCFYGCSSLTDINLSDSSVALVPAYCFAESGVTEIKLPDTCERIDNMAFYNCSDLVKITIPESVTEIHEEAFKDSDNLTIYCYTDSYAHEYAQAKGIDFVLLDAPQPISYKGGDADGDGKVTILDATKIQRVLAALDDDPDGMISLRGSCGAEELDILHATHIQRWLAGYSVAEPIGTILEYVP